MSSGRGRTPKALDAVTERKHWAHRHVARSVPRRKRTTFDQILQRLAAVEDAHRAVKRQGRQVPSFTSGDGKCQISYQTRTVADFCNQVDVAHCARLPCRTSRPAGACRPGTTRAVQPTISKSPPIKEGSSTHRRRVTSPPGGSQSVPTFENSRGRCIQRCPGFESAVEHHRKERPLPNNFSHRAICWNTPGPSLSAASWDRWSGWPEKIDGKNHDHQRATAQRKTRLPFTTTCPTSQAMGAACTGHMEMRHRPTPRSGTGGARVPTSRRG